MRRILAVLLENEAGSLSRVVGLFAQRNYNIESLTVAPTEDPTLSRLTLTTSGDQEKINQIMKQLDKLVEVVKVLEVLILLLFQIFLKIFLVISVEVVDLIEDQVIAEMI